ncbi:MATE family efflux transporter [Pseudomonas sp. 5P_3.1_Bac2]|uniref:MATE family efflux transporter n=1 Tax=Pseudomonas sp. 5P_3.1_Bac2 TaxID=2971617 RepID=UPI0021C98E68|nr:MATE family efflux transporter [Pseudomonas sp. 5P_3.1_Bac2]MCU1719364.1 MATE family efflux transporter [Pseudomonas sp. 5P_3.1_Bac2]
MNALRDAWRHSPTHKRVWALALPMILSNLSVPLVALVDTAVIGRLPHAHQLAAVAVGGSLYTLLAWSVGFLRMGTTGFSAQAAGRKDGGALRQVLLQGLLLGVGLALILSALAVPLTNVALGLMNPSPELNDLTSSFLHIRLFGLPATLTTYALVGWLLGTQNARGPLAILLTTTVLNVALEVWFVLGLNWGVAGAAWASVIAEWSGALLGLYLAQRTLGRYPGHLDWPALKRWFNWRPLLAVNRDIFIRSLALQSVFFLITVQGTRLGEATVAANALLLNGLMLTAYALDGLAHALEALCGHALGSQDRQGLRRTLWVSGAWALLASALFALFFVLGGHWFVQLQTTMPEVRAIAFTYLPYLAALPLIAVWSYLLDGLFIGATRAREMRNAMLLALGLSLPLAWALKGLGNHGLWLAFLSFMALRSLCLGAYAYHLTRTDRWFSQPLKSAD